MIQPRNSPEDVQQFCQLLRLDPDRRFVLKPSEPGMPCSLLFLSVPAWMGPTAQQFHSSSNLGFHFTLALGKLQDGH